MNLTYNDHLAWYMRDPATGSRRRFGTREHSEEFFEFEIGKCSRPIKSWYEEFVIACSKMIDEHGSNLAVFYSGGYDSEILLRELVRLGANVEAHTILFEADENNEETVRAQEVCEELRVPQYFRVHNVQEYVNSERYTVLGDKYRCTQLAYITVLEYARRVDGPVLMGGEVYIQRHATPGAAPITPTDWYYIYREDEDGMTYRYATQTGHTLINEVFTYTPELLAAWLSSNTVQKIVTGEIPGKMSLLTSKPAIFRELYPFPLAADKKLHGYENLMWTNQLVQRKMRMRLLPMQTSKLQVTKALQWLTQSNA
jgi:hypothetical protein